MSNTHHAFDFLTLAEKPKVPPVCAVFGDEPLLKRLVLAGIKVSVMGRDSDEPATTHDCHERMPDWRDVADELGTVSLFGGGRRLVVLERADAFVSTQRSRLEDYVAKPKSSGVLVLDVDEWAANTRLYKAIDQSGLQVDCRPPQKQGKSKGIDEGRIAKWIVSWGKSQHGITIATDAAQHLLELTGPVLGLIDQDLAKLALFVEPGKKVTAELVEKVVGGWRAKSTWELVDAATAGEAASALEQLDHLLQSGEHPLALVGSISWSLRQYAAATRIFQQAARKGEKMSLREALLQAGMKDWPPGKLAGAETRLKQLGRQRAGNLNRWLLELDLSLKGSHSAETRARWALEQLILRLSQQAAPQPLAPR